MPPFGGSRVLPGFQLLPVGPPEPFGLWAHHLLEAHILTPSGPASLFTSPFPLWLRISLGPSFRDT